MAQTYTALNAAILAATELDPGTDMNIVSYLPVAINLAEERLTRDLGLLGLTVYASVSVDSAFMIRPSGARVIKHLYLVASDGTQTPMPLRTDEYLKAYWPNRNSTGTPVYYAPWGFGELLLAPTPSVTMTFEISYVVRPTVLASGSDESNFFTSMCWNALFFASMTEMTSFMKNPSAVQMWQAKYEMELKNLGVESIRQIRDDQQQPGSQATENMR